MRPFHKGDLALPLAALVLAVTTYWYAQDTIRRSRSERYDPSYKLIKLTAKSVPVKVRFASNPPDGYRLLLEKVTADPPRIVVIGPEALLEGASSAETAILDISQSQKRTIKKIPVESVAGIHLAGEPYTIEVTVPIEEMEL